MAYERKAPQPPRVASIGGDPDEAPELTPEAIRTMVVDKPWSNQFDELLNLEAGWVDGEVGDWIHPEALLVAHRIMSECQAKEWRLPEVVPTEDGCIYLEWTKGTRVSAAEVYLIGEGRDKDILVDLFDWDRSDDRTWSEDRAGFQSVMTFVSNVAP